MACRPIAATTSHPTGFITFMCYHRGDRGAVFNNYSSEGSNTSV